MPTYVPVFTDNFNRPASIQGANGLTGIGNLWTDQQTNLYQLTGTFLRAVGAALNTSGFTNGHLFRPQSELALSQLGTLTFSPGFHPGAAPGNQIGGIVLGHQPGASTDHYVAFFTDSVLTVSTIISGTRTAIITQSVNSASAAHLQLSLQIDAPSAGSRLVTVTLTDLSGPTVLNTTSVSSSAATLQTAGYAGIMAVTNVGPEVDIPITQFTLATADTTGPIAFTVYPGQATQLVDSPVINIEICPPVSSGGLTINLTSGNGSDVFKTAPLGSVITSLTPAVGATSASFSINAASNALRTLTAAAAGVTSGTLSLDVGVGYQLDANFLTASNVSPSANPGAINSLGLVDVTGGFYGITSNRLSVAGSPGASLNWLLDSLDGVVQDGGVAFYFPSYASSNINAILRGDLFNTGYLVNSPGATVAISKVVLGTQTSLGTPSWSVAPTNFAAVWLYFTAIGLGTSCVVKAAWYPGNSGVIPNFASASPSGTATFTDSAASPPSARGGYYGLGGTPVGVGRMVLTQITSGGTVFSRNLYDRIGSRGVA